MRQLPTGAQAALSQRNITIRDFMWVEPRNRTTGAIVQMGFWSDLGWINAQVIDPKTGLPVMRDFKGSGNLISISQIPMTSNLSVQTVDITVSQIGDTNNLVREYEFKQARIEIFRGLFAPTTLLQLSAAVPRFVGYIDEVNIETPQEGGDGGIQLTCMSHSQEMSRYNPATRSDAYQKKRNSSDTFSQHAASVGTWELNWGGESRPIPKATSTSTAKNVITQIAGDNSWN